MNGLPVSGVSSAVDLHLWCWERSRLTVPSSGPHRERQRLVVTCVIQNRGLFLAWLWRAPGTR